MTLLVGMHTRETIDRFIKLFSDYLPTADTYCYHIIAQAYILMTLASNYLKGYSVRTVITDVGVCVSTE